MICIRAHTRLYYVCNRRYCMRSSSSLAPSLCVCSMLVRRSLACKGILHVQHEMWSLVMHVYMHMFPIFSLNKPHSPAKTFCWKQTFIHYLQKNVSFDERRSIRYFDSHLQRSCSGKLHERVAQCSKYTMRDWNTSNEWGEVLYKVTEGRTKR